MRKFIHTLTLMLLVAFVSSCNPEKRIWYLQDARPYTPEEIVESGQIRIKPLDRITVVVSSMHPELAAPFNSYSSYNSLNSKSSEFSGSNATQASLQVRTIDAEGILQMPVIGDIVAKGKTRSELAQEIADKIKQGGYITDPEVNISFADIKIAVLGEVARPGYYDLTRDKITIFDALAMAGDLTIFGVRSEVAVAREIDGVRTIEYLDLTSKELFASPAYYLQQNDIVYVKPNKYKAQAGEISQNRSFYVSLFSVGISLATLIVTITNL